MKLLFDTHAWLRQSLASERLSAQGTCLLTADPLVVQYEVQHLWGGAP